MTYPHHTHLHPHTDDDSADVLQEALNSLGPLRTTYWLGDTAITLHLLASLHQQIHERLPDAVADARDQDYSWTQIATFLATNRARAWNLYGRPGRRGHPQPLADD